MKPILFNTDMVRALLEDRKTVTRRVVKGYALEHLELDVDGSIIGVYNQFEGRIFPMIDYSPCRPGDILYVRETWRKDVVGRYAYKASDPPWGKFQWRPSIHMPREAARIFLRVTGVRVERLQEITEDQILAEGVRSKRREWLRIDFADLWNSTVRAGELPICGWDANPWVWVIEFEGISKEAIIT